MDGRTDEWMNGWMDGTIDRSIYICIRVYIYIIYIHMYNIYIYMYFYLKTKGARGPENGYPILEQGFLRVFKMIGGLRSPIKKIPPRTD